MIIGDVRRIGVSLSVVRVEANGRVGRYERSRRAIRGVVSVATYGRERRYEWSCKVDHLGGPLVLA